MASEASDRGPSWTDIATQLRLWDVEGVRYAGVAMMEEPPSGMLDFPETVAARVQGWSRGAWQGFGPGFAVGDSVAAPPRLRYLLPLVVDGFYGAMASAGELFAMLRAAGRRHRGIAPPMAEEAVRWFDYLLGLPGVATQYDVVVKCHDGRSETVRVHEIPDLLRASLAAIDSRGQSQEGEKSKEAWDLSSDCRSATKGKQRHDFAPGLQTDALQALRDAARRGTGPLTNKELGVRIGVEKPEAFRLREVFRNHRTNRMHSAWGTLIRESGRGRFRLDLSG